MSKKEKNVLGKVATTLIILTGVLNSAISTLRIYAPTQEKLIVILGYINAVLEAIINQTPIPEAPAILMRQTEAGVYAAESEPLETSSEYQEVTRAFGSNVDVSLFPDSILDADDNNLVRTM